MGRSVTRDRAAGTEHGVRYEDDLYTWAQEQVVLLRAGRLDEVDAENVAEELADVGRSEESKLDSILRVLVMHMLKWDQQPELRTPSWLHSIDEQRRRYAKLMRKNPGLKPRRDEALADMYPIARNWAASETHFDVSEFPETCPYSWDDLLNRPFEADPPQPGKHRR
jgi:predicted DNA-binding ribbon-helix-helix protein